MNTPSANAPVVLARAPSFALGAFAVDPPRRLVIGPEGAETLEPRVVQVLVALARAGGAIVTRDELVASCWGGRAIGDDAINRAIGRIRRLAESDGGASFTVETIRKVGYRLALTEAVCAAREPARAGFEPGAWMAVRQGWTAAVRNMSLVGLLSLGGASLLQGAPATASLAPLDVMPASWSEADSGPIALGDARFVFTPEAPAPRTPSTGCGVAPAGGAWLDGQTGQPSAARRSLNLALSLDP